LDNAMFRTIDAWNTRMKERLELTAIQMTPASLFDVIPTWQLTSALWARPLNARIMF
jgi:hypothetical protein